MLEIPTRAIRVATQVSARKRSEKPVRHGLKRGAYERRSSLPQLRSHRTRREARQFSSAPSDAHERHGEEMSCGCAGRALRSANFRSAAGEHPHSVISPKNGAPRVTSAGRQSDPLN